MRTSLSFLLAASIVPACVLVTKSPALSGALHERLAKADTPRIVEGAKACLLHAGFTPDDITGEAEGATVVSAKNSAKDRVTVYIQPPGMNPRVTGDPPYDDPFWPCLERDLARAKVAPADGTSSADVP